MKIEVGRWGSGIEYFWKSKLVKNFLLSHPSQPIPIGSDGERRKQKKNVGKSQLDLPHLLHPHLPHPHPQGLFLLGLEWERRKMRNKKDWLEEERRKRNKESWGIPSGQGKIRFSYSSSLLSSSSFPSPSSSPSFLRYEDEGDEEDEENE